MSRLIPTRWSHLIGYSGVGAVVRADNDLFVIEDISRWTDRAGEPAGAEIPYVTLLRASLGIDRQLRHPPVSRELPNGHVDGVCVPAMRFPGWMRCPSCGLLHWLPWRNQPGDITQREPARCSCTRRSRLQQVGWALAYPEGGLQEVPWHALAHRDARSQGDTCRVDRKSSRIYLTRDAETGTRWFLHCRICNARAPFDPKQSWHGGDPMRQPWEESGSVRHGESPIKGSILEISDPRLHFPHTRSALVIPPESRVRRGTVVDRLYGSRSDRDDIEHARPGLPRRQILRSLASRLGCTAADIEDALSELQKGYPHYGETVTPGDLMGKEYLALQAEIPNLADNEDFVPHDKTQAWRAQIVSEGTRESSILAAVSRVVAVTRLRVVKIFEGFTRVTPNAEDGLRPDDVSGEGDRDGKARLVSPDLGKNLDWLPAVELYGEGIFFTLSELVLRRWEDQPNLRLRIQDLERRFERTGMYFPDTPLLPLPPRFVLLHTLAHLLIRQLETQAGYPAASLQERIYSAEGDDPMAGVLVYVAVPDVVGSLGGLAELAEPARFLRLLSGVFSRADWCSLDPVCAEHEGQGPSQLNRAACHGCALVPEPSCQFRNLLLDRVFIRGDLHGQIRPLLDFVAPG